MEMQLRHSANSKATLGAIDEDDKMEAELAVARKKNKKGMTLKERKKAKKEEKAFKDIGAKAKHRVRVRRLDRYQRM